VIPAAEQAVTLSAEDLARQVQAGSSAAFSQLVGMHVDRLYRYLRLRTRTHQDAEDLVQETFLRAYGSIARFQPDKRFSTWLFTIATRLAVDHHRARRTGVDVETLDPPDDRASDPHQAVVRQEQRDWLWLQARQALPGSQFAVLWLRYAEDMPVKEIAAIVGKTRIHVKVLLHRARRKLIQLQTGEIQDASRLALPATHPQMTQAGGAKCGAD
jgi:RNA polymerase sigma-70 factor (ECF subfamily)